MRVAVYSVTLNNEKQIRRWRESTRAADYWGIFDLGSSDRTTDIALELGCGVCSISQANANYSSLFKKGLRFDEAWNTAFSSVSIEYDYCIALKMNETISQGWREEIEKAHLEHTNRIEYEHVDVNKKIRIDDKIHSINYFSWKRPIDSKLCCLTTEVRKKCNILISEKEKWDIDIDRLPLLELSFNENSNSPDVCLSYAKELFLKERTEDSLFYFKKYIDFKDQDPEERADAMRFISELEPEFKDAWLLRSQAELLMLKATK